MADYRNHDPGEAENARLVYDLYLHCDGMSGPMGANKIADQLNRLDHRTRSGRPFSKQYIIKILRNEAYMGTYWFG